MHGFSRNIACVMLYMDHVTICVLNPHAWLFEKYCMCHALYGSRDQASPKNDFFCPHFKLLLKIKRE